MGKHTQTSYFCGLGFKGLRRKKDVQAHLFHGTIDFDRDKNASNF